MRVLIAPARVRNARRPRTTPARRPVLIAPARVRNRPPAPRRRPTTSSSSPLRGFATCRPAPVPTTGPGPHRPCEGSQREAAGQCFGPGRGPHRPCEGSQQAGGDEVEVLGGSSSPLRGFATACRRRRQPGRVPGPHRPCEGSQPGGGQDGVQQVTGPHRPCEGSQHLPGQVVREGQRPHRPCEGSQPQHRAHRPPLGLSSSPLRGFATRRTGRDPRRGSSVLIAPARVRNAMVCVIMACPRPRPHRPCEGSQTHLRRLPPGQPRGSPSRRRFASRDRGRGPATGRVGSTLFFHIKRCRKS